jgi:hypothetical protein
VAWDQEKVYFKGMAVVPEEFVEKNNMEEFLQILKPDKSDRISMLRRIPRTPLGWMGMPAISGNGE